MELAELTPEHFDPLVGERFTVGASESRVDAGMPELLELELAAIERLPPHRYRAAPFTLAFRGPRRQPLTQGTYALGHPRLGDLELFLVPIGGDASTLTYEAIFN
jgi:hypothetical protein